MSRSLNLRRYCRKQTSSERPLLAFRKKVALAHGPLSPSLARIKAHCGEVCPDSAYILKSKHDADLAQFWGSRELPVMIHQELYGQLPKYNALKWKVQGEVRSA